MPKPWSCARCDSRNDAVDTSCHRCAAPAPPERAAPAAPLGYTPVDFTAAGGPGDGYRPVDLSSERTTAFAGPGSPGGGRRGPSTALVATGPGGPSGLGAFTPPAAPPANPHAWLLAVAAGVAVVLVAVTALVWAVAGGDDPVPGVAGSAPVAAGEPEVAPGSSAVVVPPAAQAQRVTGPRGLTISIPAGWQVVGMPVAANLEAHAPGDPSVFVRFGGSDVPAGPVLDHVTGGEQGNERIRAGYARVGLAPVAYLGSEAADWEFEFDRDGVRRHAFGRYWYQNGSMYVIYASAPVDRWPTVLPVLQEAIATAVVG